jgi:hypothetical protein
LAARRPGTAITALLLLTLLTVLPGYGGENSAPQTGDRSEIPAGSLVDAVAATLIAEASSVEDRNPQGSLAIGGGPHFTEVAEPAGLDFRYTFGDYAYDNILESSGSGVTWLDYDRDGDVDLYFLNGVYLEGVSDPKGRINLASASNRFYCNNGDGTFHDCTARSGLGDSSWSMAAVAGDFDDDGYPDLFVANYGPNRVYRNNGDGTWSEKAADLGLVGPSDLNGFVKWSVGGSWFDADGDGDLDLAVCNFLAFDPDLLVPGKEWEMPEPKEYKGQPSHLFLQQPDGRFVDITHQAGLLRPDSKCMGITVLDVNEDGRLDILQTNDHQPNFLFRSGAGVVYDEVGAESGLSVNDQGLGTGSMHGTPGDVDGDGRIDFLVVDLRHGSLYLGAGEGLFTDSTWASGVGNLLDGLGQWGAGLVDFDLDGDLDLFTTNGVAHILVEQYPMLATNDGRGHFIDSRKGAGAFFQTRRSGRGAAFADYDNDGDIDIVVNHVDHRATPGLLRNDTVRRGRWMTLELVGRQPQTSHGAQITVQTTSRSLVRAHQPAASYLSGNDSRVHVGLGEEASSPEVRVRWPSGRTQAWLSLPVDHRYVLFEGSRRTQATR